VRCESDTIAGSDPACGHVTSSYDTLGMTLGMIEHELECRPVAGVTKGWIVSTPGEQVFD
jgi:hypothetical protein